MIRIVSCPIVDVPDESIVTDTVELVSICDDGRMNINLCEPIAIYPIYDDEGTHIVIYNVERGDDIGEFALFLSADDLTDVPDSLEVPIELARSQDGFVTVYYLPSNEYQINVGPDDEGKVFVYRFTTIPQLPVIDSFFADRDLAAE